MPRQSDPVLGFRANAEAVARALPRDGSVFRAVTFTDAVRAALRVAALAASEGALVALHEQARAAR